MQAKMHHHWEAIKQLLINTVWDQVNAVNVVIGSAYLHFFVFLGIMAFANSVQVGLGIACGFVLLAYNCLKFYRLWKSKEEEE